jgi:5-methylcytosine-specific restriction endonuclease McrBC regulatory subunit McrC
MPRQYEIESAFRAAVKIEQTGRRTVTTQDFVKQLKVVNWNWSLKQANNWIECYVTTFKDISSEEGEARTFMLFNPNGGL